MRRLSIFLVASALGTIDFGVSPATSLANHSPCTPNWVEHQGGVRTASQTICRWEWGFLRACRNYYRDTRLYFWQGGSWVLVDTNTESLGNHCYYDPPEPPRPWGGDAGLPADLVGEAET